MKQEDPIRIDSQRASEPSGGIWEKLDPLGEGLVQILDVPGLPSQPGCVLAEIRRLRSLSSETVRWEDIAILGRTRAQLTPVRAIFEEYEVPLDWACGYREGLPLHLLREIKEGFDILDAIDEERGPEPLVLASEIREAFKDFADEKNAWKKLFLQILDDWAADSRQPVQSVVQFVYDALFQMKADHRQGRGIFIGTAHSAKGLEFKHVFILDGGWSNNGGTLESERRLFYVAMTRAMENLVISRSNEVPNCFVDSLREAEGAFVRKAEECVDCDSGLLGRKYEFLGMGDLYLDLGSRERKVREAVAKLRANDPLTMREFDQRVAVFDSSDRRVATLSARASKEWVPRLKEVELAKVFAVACRRREDCAPEYQAKCIVDVWEVPLIEGVLKSPQLLQVS